MTEGVFTNIISAPIIWVIALILGALGISPWVKKKILSLFSNKQFSCDEKITESKIVNLTDFSSLKNEVVFFLNENQFEQIDSYMNLPIITDEELLIENVDEIHILDGTDKKIFKNVHLHLKPHKPESKYFNIYINNEKVFQNSLLLNFENINKIEGSLTVSNIKQHHSLYIKITAYSDHSVEYMFKIKSGVYSINDCIETYNYFSKIKDAKSCRIEESNKEIVWEINVDKFKKQLLSMNPEFLNYIDISLEAYQFIKQLKENKFLSLKNIPIKLTNEDIVLTHNLYNYLICKNYETQLPGFDSKFIKNPVINKMFLRNILFRTKLKNISLKNPSYISSFHYLNKEVTFKGLDLEFELLDIENKISVFIILLKFWRKDIHIYFKRVKKTKAYKKYTEIVLP